MFRCREKSKLLLLRYINIKRNSPSLKFQNNKETTMSYEYLDNLENDAKIRYKKKLEVADLQDCPYRLPANVWKEDTSVWPNFHYGDIYDYLINTPGKASFL